MTEISLKLRSFGHPERQLRISVVKGEIYDKRSITKLIADALKHPDLIQLTASIDRPL